MAISKKEYFIFFLAFITLILAIFIVNWINYLSKNDYVYYETSFKENFDSTYISDGHVSATGSHAANPTANLPLNTTFSCRNKCGPANRCSISGHQCLSDMDCPGCQPNMPNPRPYKKYVPPYNDAGKLTVGVTPTYSSLTTDIGTQSRQFKGTMNTPTPKISNGTNTWSSKFNNGKMLYDSKFAPPQLQYMPKYSKRYTPTGEFIDIGPLASNAYLN